MYLNKLLTLLDLFNLKGDTKFISFDYNLLRRLQSPQRSYDDTDLKKIRL